MTNLPNPIPTLFQAQLLKEVPWDESLLPHSDQDMEILYAYGIISFVDTDNRIKIIVHTESGPRKTLPNL